MLAPRAVPVPEGGIPAIAEKYKCPVGAMDACLALFFTRAADPKGRDTDSFVRSQVRLKPGVEGRKYQKQSTGASGGPFPARDERLTAR